LRRPYLYSALRGEGRFTLDNALGLVDSYSPEVLRWVCRAAALAGSYQAASQDLLTYAGLEIDARQIQRLVQQVAPAMNRWRAAQAPLFNPRAGDILCVGTDGTGAPMRRREVRGAQRQAWRQSPHLRGQGRHGLHAPQTEPTRPTTRTGLCLDHLPGSHRFG
jgi:hypothetical protein